VATRFASRQPAHPGSEIAGDALARLLETARASTGGLVAILRYEPSVGEATVRASSVGAHDSDVLTDLATRILARDTRGDSHSLNGSSPAIHRLVSFDHRELAKLAPNAAIPDGAHGVACAGIRGKREARIAIITDAATSPLRLAKSADLAVEAALYALAFDEQCQSLEFWKHRTMAAAEGLAREQRNLETARRELDAIEDSLGRASTRAGAETRAPSEAVQALHRELAEHRALVKRLGLRMFSAIDEERARIARDLHDDQAQLLSAARIALEAGPEKSRPIFQRLEDELRRKVRALRPAALGQMTLKQALAEELKRAADAGLVTRLSMRAAAGNISGAAQQLCFHVAREAISNVIRHARASRVRIAVEPGRGSVTVSISDDGVGIAFAKGHGSGLVGLRERVELMGGTVSIKSVAKGTRVIASIPELE